MSGRKCPLCSLPAIKVIYMGFPMLLCSDSDDCSCLWGMWAWLITSGLIPFNGVFMTYTRWYPLSLWAWLRGDWQDRPY